MLFLLMGHPPFWVHAVTCKCTLILHGALQVIVNMLAKNTFFIIREEKLLSCYYRAMLNFAQSNSKQINVNESQNNIEID